MKKGMMLAALMAAMGGPAVAQTNDWAAGAGEQAGALLDKGFQHLKWSLLLETEGYFTRIDGVDASDLVQATVAFKIETEVTDWLRGNLGLLWEQYSREDDNVDEAFITLGASEEMPFYFVTGRFYQPVGSFESVFISDPLTLELMEMNQVAAMAGYGNDWIDANIGAFSGDVKAGFEVDGVGNTNTISDSSISDFYASVTFSPIQHVHFGAYWLSDLMETYNFGGVGASISDQPGYDQVDGAGAFVNVYLGAVTLNAEFASALDAYQIGGGNYTPSAYNLEASCRCHKRITMGLKYEGSRDLYAGYDRTLLSFGDKYPGRSYGAVIAYDLHEHAAIAAEYLRVEDLDDDASGHLATMQLAFEI